MPVVIDPRLSGGDPVCMGKGSGFLLAAKFLCLELTHSTKLLLLNKLTVQSMWREGIMDSRKLVKIC